MIIAASMVISFSSQKMALYNHNFAPVSMPESKYPILGSRKGLAFICTWFER
jgi:hypothetical protein